MKHLSLHLLLSVAIIGQVNAMTNTVCPRIIQPKQAPKIESPATNGMNDIDNNDDDDYTVEAELMGDAQTNGGNGSAMQLEAGEPTNVTDDAMQNGQEAASDYGAYGVYGAYGMGMDIQPDVIEESTDMYADTQDTQNTQDITTAANGIAAETKESIAATEEEILK